MITILRPGRTLAVVSALRNDRGAAYALLSRAVSGLSGLGLALLATASISPAEQGYFFVFLNLLVAQVVVELGFGQVFMQFVSHEAPRTRVEAGRVAGDSRYVARLASLVRLGALWYSGSALALFFVLAGGGSVFFALGPSTDVAWQGPWLVLCACQALALLVLPLVALLEGVNRVEVTQRTALIANCSATAAAATTLVLGGGLYALAVLVATRAAVTLLALNPAVRPYLRLARAAPAGERVSFRQEFWPQQWRIAVSLLAGFGLLNAFAPITLQVLGPQEAGYVGLAAQIFLSVNQLASSWLVSIQPSMGELASRRDVVGLGRLVRITTIRCLTTAGALALAVVITLEGLRIALPHAEERLGPRGVVILFCVAAVVLQIVNVRTAAVRFSKREPFATVNVLSSMAVVGLAAVGADTVGAAGVPAAFLIVLLGVLLPATLILYRRHMEQWLPR